jgi:hypothetical protein
MPGQPAPRSCGSLEVQVPTSTGTGTTGTGGTGTTGGGNNAPIAGTADLGEPCQSNAECRRGLRCGSTHTCVFVNQR